MTSVFELQPNKLTIPFPPVPGIIFGVTIFAWSAGLTLVFVIKTLPSASERVIRNAGVLPETENPWRLGNVTAYTIPCHEEASQL